MSSPQPGSLLLFRRLTLRQALHGYGIRGIPTWLAHWCIAICQLIKSGGPQPDGYWQYVHAAIIIYDILVASPTYLMEFTAGRPGMRMWRTDVRLAAYPGAVDCYPLSERYTWDAAKAQRWASEHDDWDYDFWGLPFAVTSLLSGRKPKKKLFCSSSIIAILLDQTIVPPELMVVRGGRLVMSEVKPQTYSPAEVGRIPQFKRNSAFCVKE